MLVHLECNSCLLGFSEKVEAESGSAKARGGCGALGGAGEWERERL